MFKTNRRNQTPRNLVAKLMGWNADANALEQRIVPAYVSGDFGWASTFETGNVQIEQYVRSSAVDSSGNVYQVGSFTGTVDFDPGTGTTNVTAVGGQDAFVEKLDSTGKLVWVKTFSGTTNEKATSITLDASGNPIITGWYQGTVDFDPSSTVNNLTSQGAEDAFIVKLSGNGAFQWAKTVGGTGSDQGFSIITDTVGNIIVGGLFSGTADFDPSAGVANLQTSYGNQDIFISKYDANGNCVWAKGVIGQTNNSKEIHDIETDSNNNVLLCGTFLGKIDLDPGAGVYSITNASSNYNGYFVKLDSTGTFQWAQQIASSVASRAISIAYDLADNIYITGMFHQTVDFDPTSAVFNLTSNGQHDTFLEKLTPNGKLTWAKSWGGDNDDYSFSVKVDINNRIKIAGVMGSPKVDFDPSPNISPVTNQGSYPTSDIYVSLFEPNGDFYGVKILGEPKQDWFQSMCLSTSGRIIIFGAIEGAMDFDPDSPVQSLAVVGTANNFITQWNRQFTKTTVSVSDSFTGANTTLTATIQNEDRTGSTGTVTFTDVFNGVTTTLGTATVTNGVATLLLPIVAVGVHNFSASYSGDATNFSSNSYPLVSHVDAVAGNFGWAAAIVNRTGTEEAASIDKKWGHGWDVDNSNTTIRSYFEPGVKVATDSAGNVWYGGTFTGNVDVNSSSGTTIATSATGRSIYLVKTNKNGLLQDSKVWSGDGRNGISSLTIDKSGAIIITGYFYGSLDFDTSSGLDIKTSNGGEDGFAVVLNSDGTHRYSRTFGGTSDDYIQKAYLDNKSSLVIASVFKGNVNLAQGVSLSSSSSEGVVALINYSASGTIQYAKQLGNDNISNSAGLAIDASTNSVFWAVVGGTNMDLDPGPGVVLSGTYGSSIIKLNENGIYQKSVHINASWQDGIRCCDLIIGPNGSIYISGCVYFDFYPSATEFFYSKYDLDLNRTFIQEWSTPGNAGDPPAHTKINVDQFGNVYLAGSFLVPFDLDPSSSSVQMTSKGNDDVFYAKFSPTNQLLNYGQIGGTGFDRSYSAALSTTGALLIGGFFTGTVDFDPTSGTANLSTDPNVANSRSRFVMSLANFAPVTTAISLTTTPTSSVYGQSVTLNAALNAMNGATPSGLTASFYDGTTLLGTSTVTNGLASLSLANLAVGSHSFTAKIVDATNVYLTSTSTAVAFTVSKSDTQIALTSSTNPSVYGQSVTFTSTVSAKAPGAGSPSGTVTFKDGTTVLGTSTLNASGVATFATSALGVASHSITSVYNGDANFTTTTSTAVTQVVNQAATSTVLTSSATSSIFGQSVTFTGTVTANSPGAGTPSGTVSFKDGTTLLGTGTLNASGVATFSTSTLAVGNHSITAVYESDLNFSTSTSGAISLSILPNTTKIQTFTQDASTVTIAFNKAIATTLLQINDSYYYSWTCNF